MADRVLPEYAQQRPVVTTLEAARGTVRPLRSELKMFTALPVVRLRARADVLAREIRDLDVRIQRANWEFGLME